MAISGIRGEGIEFGRPSALPAPVRVREGGGDGVFGRPSALLTPARAREGGADGVFARAMRGLAREIDVGEARTAAAAQLRQYDTGTLIALQVGIYRYTEAVDLASKIVDRATNAVRTVLQGGGH